jgi:hypothetical protein
MTKDQITKLEEQIVNCELLHVAIETLEKLRHEHLPEGLQERWIAEMKEEAGFQVSQHDEDRKSFVEHCDTKVKRDIPC